MTVHSHMTPQTLSDSDLLTQLKTRDPQVLSEVVRAHLRPLIRAARAMGVEEASVEDLVQEVFATFLSSLDRFEGRSQLRTWLFGILYRKIFEFRRARAVKQKHCSIDEVFEKRFDPQGNWSRPVQDVHRLLESSQAGDLIQGCLEELSHKQRSVFTLREVDGLDSVEICKILDISDTNLGVLMFRGRNRLRECMEAKGWKNAR